MPNSSARSAPATWSVLCSVLVCLQASAHAQQFTRQPIAQTDGGPGTPTPIDLDGDGDLDFVAFVVNNRFLQHWRNVGGSRFASFATTPAVQMTNLFDGRPAAGDLDGDGAADLLVVVANSGVLTLLRNQQGRLPGPAVALPPTNIGAVIGARLLDADGDRDLDILVRGTSGLALLLNDGLANFTSAPTRLPLSFGNSLAEVADLDLDGKADLIVADSGPPSVWMSRQNGFVDESAGRLPPLPTIPRRMVPVDIDNDGDLDLAGITDTLPMAAVLLRNNGAGAFTDVSATLPQVPPTAASLVPADLDGDGDSDLLLDRFILQNDGGGLFVPAGTLPITPTAAIDLDGDRWTDLMTNSALVRNAGGRDFVPMDRCRGIASGDLDGDGDQDWIGLNGIAWLTEGSRHSLRPFGINISLQSRLADLDRDGDDDLIVRASNTVEVLANNGNGTFTSVWRRGDNSVLGQPVTVLDIERDGDLDLAWGSGTITLAPPVLLRNDGMTFTDVSATALPPGLFAPTLVAGDVDADGYDDLLAVNLVSTTCLHNRGNGTFAPATAQPPAGFGGQTVRPIQIDGDPELELLAIRNPALLLIDRVNGAWVDANWRMPASAGPATDAIALDFDTDGDLDLAVSGGGGFLLRNLGNGVFADVTTTLGPFPATSWATVDADGDGDPDLVDGVDLWLNQERQLDLAAPVAVGGQLVAEFVAQPGFGVDAAVCVVTLGLQRSAAGLPMFGGRWLPEPSASVIFGVVVSVTGTRGRSRLPVPNNPLLRGLTLQLQGLVIGTRGELALANHLTVTID